MKRAYYSLFICIIFSVTHPMTMETLPKELLISVIRSSFPLNKSYDNWKEYYKATSNYLIQLHYINHYFNTTITHSIHTILNFKKDINAFLVDSSRAHIPYFIKIAIQHGADPDIMYNPDAHTPLSYATSAHCYATCKFLLENGAYVNWQLPGVSGYGHNIFHKLPITIAIQNRDAQLVNLLITKGARLNMQIGDIEDYSLLSIAAENNDPNTLATLLNSCPSTDYPKNWGLDEIHDAMIIRPAIHPDDLKRRECLNLLVSATYDTMQHTEPPASTLFLLFIVYSMEMLFSYLPK